MSNRNERKNEVPHTTAQVRLLPGDDSLQPVRLKSVSPALYAEKQVSWQKMVNLIARLTQVPSCFIVQLRPDDMLLLVSSESKGNPYLAGESYPLGEGRCCEAVYGSNKPVLVENATNHPDWQGSLSFSRNMNSYYGLPLTWPDGEFFGSLCILDWKSNRFDGDSGVLIHEIHEILMEDLKTIQTSATLQQKQDQHAEKIAWQETHDLLTNLLTPYAFKRSAKETLPSRLEQIVKKSAVGILNVNYFKKLNEQYGYAMADQVLQHIATLLEKLHQHGTIQLAGRYGGDKFSFLITGIQGEADVATALQPLFETLRIPLRLGNDDVTITCTTGVCLFPDSGFDIDELIMKADLIQGRTKERGGLRFYNSTVNEKIQRELRIQRSLEQAIHDGEISVHYQPQINSAGLLAGVEALVRWTSTTLGPVFPDEFIPIAENSDLIHELGLYIFETACRDIKPIRIADRPLKVSINVSPRQFLHADFLSSLTAIVRDTGIAPERITIEITENVLLDDFDEVLPLFTHLIENGFGLSIDDFGTGYSSLKYLSKLPLTEVKVDRSFINDITTNLQNQLLVKSVIAISRAGRIQVVAEGVETEEQAEWLLANNCTLQQGWLYDKAMPIDILLSRYTSSKGRVRQIYLFTRNKLLSLLTEEKIGEQDSREARELLNKGIFNFYVENIFEYLLYIHADTGRTVGTGKARAGLFQAKDFNQFAEEYISRRFALNDDRLRQQLQKLVHLDCVLERLQQNGDHTIVTPQQQADGSVAYKRGTFHWLDRDNRIIIFSCVDISGVYAPPNDYLFNR